MGGLYIPWLVDAARLTGYPVVEVAGYRARGHGGFRALEIFAAHHTADGPGEMPSLNIVTKGRSDLPGPLCNYGLGRSGTIYVVAAGVAWHAGASTWAGFTDLNDEAIGVEAESRGTQNDWTPAQLDCYPRLAAACLYYMKRNAARICGHKECCKPRGRKIDPAFIDMNWFRDRTAWLLADPLSRIPKGSPAPPSGWFRVEDCVFPVIAPAQPGDAKKPGERGAPREGGNLHWYIMRVQACLNVSGVSRWIMPDGIYGDKTVEMVRELQSKRKIPVTGVVDKTTLDWLLGNPAPDYVNG